MADRKFIPQLKAEDGSMVDMKIDAQAIASSASEVNISSTNSSSSAVNISATAGGVAITAATELTVNTHKVKSVITDWTIDEAGGTINITVEDLF